ncbi:MAG TPA: LysR family transcriptional regulator [Casimicrobiaceae bacterium]|nr:LysR family transcriptional regulator [Casimicrobiaceae bacterium]
MLESVSLDHLRMFIAAADEGSFSAGGRRLRRAQSVISQTLANLEAQLGVKLFDRSSRSPVLTTQGLALLAEARAVVSRMDVFKARAKGLSDGLEPELSVVVDVMFPLDQLTCAVAAFQEEFPATPLRLYVEALGAVLQPVMDGRCAFGVMGSLPTAPAQLTRERLISIGWSFVASPTHPLASLKGAIPARVLARHRQLVLTDRSELSQGKEFGVFSSNTWRLADLGAKHAFLRAGLGWGGMPVNAIETDLANGSLVKIAIEDIPNANLVMVMSAVFRTDRPPGPAGRWLIEHLKSSTAPRARAAKAKRAR